MSDRAAPAAERLRASGEASREEVVGGILRLLATTSAELPESPGLDEPLFFESLPATELHSAIELEFGVGLSLESFFEDCTVGNLADAVLERIEAGGAGAAVGPVVTHDERARFEPFQLTDVQQAYWLGRSDTFELGGRSTYLYLEADVTGIEVEALEAALNAVIERHDMMRAIVLPDGRQVVLESLEPYRIVTGDLRDLAADEAQRRLAATRDEMSHKVFPADRWPLWEARAHRLAGGAFRLHFGIDLVLMDATSVMLLFRELFELALDPGSPVPPPAITFRDYLLAAETIDQSPAHQRARDYWLERIDTLPPAPELPIVPDAPTHAPRFVRRSTSLDPEAWRRLKEHARAAGVTPAALLCTAYVEVLRTWSKRSDFTLNVTLGDRPGWHPDVRRMLGDFTSTLLLQCEPAPGEAFAERARRLQRQLRSDLEHRRFSGIAVQRELARRGSAARAFMPVVFTSVLHESDAISQYEDLLAEEVYAISQTPQVHLDNQVVQRGGRVAISWDAPEDLFPPGVLDAMFDAYTRLLTRLVDDERTLTEPVRGLVPLSQLGVRARVNDTAAPIPSELLHEAAGRGLAAAPGAPAVIDAEQTLTAAALDEHANRVAHRLRELGVRPNARVAVLMEKGWEQVVAVLGILRAGGAYLPLDAALPEDRIRHLLRHAQVEVALSQRGVLARLPAIGGLTVLAIDDDGEWEGDPPEPLEPVQQAGDLAYVIFTSGSTGLPKGVMIDHRGAVNTCADVNRRFGVGSADRVLGLSSLSFDLSVYDVFGLLGAGGALVLPGAGSDRDPGRWAELLERHEVTVWNTVPALLELLVDYLEQHGRRLPPSLRLVLLSGDWIPLSLPDRVRRLAETPPELISLGGATEASIWSILHPIGAVDRAWRSIPYGRPMANQTFHVLDGELEPRPDWVAGELYIGGAGVARGYLRDPDRTAMQFLEHPETGERLYRTGDTGRYLPDGTIEFLGREDLQVKVGGHRVELGEIEAVLGGHPTVRACVAAALGERQGPKRLVAYVVRDEREPEADGDLAGFLAARLPAYMVPTTFVLLPSLPLTANGKVDRRALPAPELVRDESDADEPPATDGERTLAAVWRDVLGIEEIGRRSSFIELGGDSLFGIRAIARAAEAGLWLTPKDFFANPILAEQAALARTEPPTEACQGPVAGPVALTPAQRWFFDHDFAEPHHWNGMWPLFVLDRPLDPEALRVAFEETLLHHDFLRARFDRGEAGWEAEIGGPEVAAPGALSVIDLCDCADGEFTAALERQVAEQHASLDLAHGPLVRLTYFELGAARPPRLLVSAHWLVMDYYASRVFFEDLRTAYFQIAAGGDVELPPKTASVPQCLERLEAEARSPERAQELPLWTRFAAAPNELPLDFPDGLNVQGSARRVQVDLDGAEAESVLHGLPQKHGAEVREVLLTAMLRAVTAWTGEPSMLVELEGHGREAAYGDLDVSRTIGRFSTLSPVALELGDGLGPVEELHGVMRQLRAIQDRGVGYGILRYLHPDAQVRDELARVPQPALGFNFWGDVSEYFADDARPTAEAFGPHRSAAAMRPRVLDFMALAAGGALVTAWTYSENLHREDAVTGLADRFVEELRALAGAAGRDAVTA